MARLRTGLVADAGAFGDAFGVFEIRDGDANRDGPRGVLPGLLKDLLEDVAVGLRNVG